MTATDTRPEDAPQQVADLIRQLVAALVKPHPDPVLGIFEDVNAMAARCLALDVAMGFFEPTTTEHQILQYLRTLETTNCDHHRARATYWESIMKRATNEARGEWESI